MLEKRRRLIDAGWPRQALLVTVVRDRKGDGQAVLTVKTERGDFVLDNQDPRVRAWTDTGYKSSSGSRRRIRASGSRSAAPTRESSPPTAGSEPRGGELTLGSLSA